MVLKKAANFERHFVGTESAEKQDDVLEKKKLSASGEKKRDQIIEAYENFMAKTGMVELKKFIEKLRAADSDAAIDHFEANASRAATHQYKKDLIAKGCFNPRQGEEKFVAEELKSWLKWFPEMPLLGEHGKIQTLLNLDEYLKPRIAFREELEGLSETAFREFTRLRGTVKYFSRKEALLEEIKTQFKAVEKAPEAVQAEFRRQQEKTSASQNTKELLSKIEKEFGELCKTYDSLLDANKAVFGGNTRQEFKDWIRDRDGLDEMKKALKALPKLIKIREKLHQEKEDILSHAPLALQKILRARLNKLGRSELKKALPKVQKHIQTRSLHLAEFVAEMHGKYQGIKLFDDKEIRRRSKRLAKLPVRTQQLHLQALEDEVAERTETIDAYFQIPAHLRGSDTKFTKSPHIQRLDLLEDAEDAFEENQNHAFASLGENDGQELDSRQKQKNALLFQKLSKNEHDQETRHLENKADREFQAKAAAELEALRLQIAVRKQMRRAQEYMRSQSKLATSEQVAQTLNDGVALQELIGQDEDREEAASTLENKVITLNERQLSRGPRSLRNTIEDANHSQLIQLDQENGPSHDMLAQMQEFIEESAAALEKQWKEKMAQIFDLPLSIQTSSEAKHSLDNYAAQRVEASIGEEFELAA